MPAPACIPDCMLCLWLEHEVGFDRHLQIDFQSPSKSFYRSDDAALFKESGSSEQKSRKR